MTEDEMIGWHHRVNGHESEQAPGVSDGQGRLACCSPQSHIESDVTQRLNNNKPSHSQGHVCLLVSMSLAGN